MSSLYCQVTVVKSPLSSHHCQVSIVKSLLSSHRCQVTIVITIVSLPLQQMATERVHRAIHSTAEEMGIPLQGHSHIVHGRSGI
jgi:hypothetical protein